ncbi:MAG: proton-conducting transporter membrane subunit [Kiritimatiellales bacterium]|jgi:ech hydrogenase subunit A
MIENLIPWMVAFPLLAGIVLLFISGDTLRRYAVYAATAAIMAGSILLAWKSNQNTMLLDGFAHNISLVMLVVETLIAGFLLRITLKAKNWLAAGLLLAQFLLVAGFEVHEMMKSPSAAESVASAVVTVSPWILCDQLSVIMVLVIGIIGGLICIYTPGYMKEFHQQHPEFRDRRPLFFATFFIFLGAMFGIVFANSLNWLYFFWEITTLSSFLLIGYKETDESKTNAMRALTMNLMGGLGFALAIVLLGNNGIASLMDLRSQGHASQLIVIAAGLLAFAGITKAAQFPFAGWLRGAMVAPTPVSALLHSSTMVKAGVYLVLRLAPNLEGTKVGLAVALVGAVTFVAGSLVAICTSDAKKILAYSTVSNLGLIVLCGGIGTKEAVWAGILLIIFHAVAKALLFLCVGVVEHRTHSRDVEDMAGLVIRMPKIAVMIEIGIAGMFLAPFGMLISKWAVLKAIVDAHPLLSIFIVFGSSATLFFWVKWLGKLLQITGSMEKKEKGISGGKWIALGSLAVLTILTCISFPLISDRFIEPYIGGGFKAADSVLGTSNLIVMGLMLAMVAMFPLSFFNYNRKVKVVDAYLAGANVESTDGQARFQGSAGTVREMSMHNYYIGQLLGEERVFKAGFWIAIATLVALAGTFLLPIGLPQEIIRTIDPHMLSFKEVLIRLAAYLVLAPVIGGLLAGIDRKLTARMQGRRGPPVRQAFYDVAKLWGKESVVVRRSQNFYVLFFFLFVVFTGALFFCGSDLLLVIFSLTLAGIFLVLAAYKASSPYSFIGAERELIQMVAYEPMVLMAAVGMYMTTGSFRVDDIFANPVNPLKLILIFIGFLYILEIKFRKSPFDLSTSHHAHQELVKGITTEFSGKMLALIEIAHWYENVILFAWVGLFFAFNLWVGAAAMVLVFFFMIFVDNTFARLKWQLAIKSAWTVTLVLAVANLILLALWK